jgi:hypothetical protein
MKNPTSRPVSVWITQILFAIFICVWTFGLFYSLSRFRNPMQVPLLQWFGLIFLIIFVLILISVLSVSFWGLAKRKPFARWLAVGILGFIFMATLFGQLTSPSGPFHYKEYANTNQFIGGMIGTFLFYGLHFSLIFSLAKSEKVSRFFQTQTNKLEFNNSQFHENSETVENNQTQA